MTIEVEASSISYNGDGVTTDFPTTFSFGENADLDVSLTSGGVTTALVLDVDYSVTGAGAAEPGGTVTWLSTIPPAVGETLLIERNTAITQLTDFRTSGPYAANTITRAFDKLTRIAQERDRRIAALEALSELVDVTTLADGVEVDDTFSTDADDVESTFPFAVTAVGGKNAAHAILRVYPHNDPSHRFDTSPFVQWKPGSNTDEIIIVGIDGLDPATDYDIKGLVLF